MRFEIQLSRIVQPITNEIRIDPPRSNSIDASLSIQSHDLILHRGNKPILQPSFARSILSMPSLAEFATLAASHDNSQILQLATETLLGRLCSEEEMLDGQESSPDIDAVDILPRFQG